MAAISLASGLHSSQDASDLVADRDEEHAFLVRYRAKHAITGVEHASTLRSMGVTTPGYQEVRRHSLRPDRWLPASFSEGR